jgi:hypothetical protein
MNHPASMKVSTVIGYAAARATQWRPLLLLVILGWVPTAILAVPVWRLLAEQLDASVQAAQWAQHFDVLVVADLMARFGLSGSALAGSGIAAALVFVLLLPFQQALLVSAARTDERLPLGTLLHAGLREYGPMLRMLLVSLIPLGVALGLAALAFKGVSKYAQHAILATDVDHVSWLADALAGLLIVFALASVEAGRARFAWDPRKRSAFKAWWRGFKMVLLHPLRGFGIFLGIAIPALVVLAALALLRVELPGGGALALVGGWIVVQLIAAVMAWASFARLAGYFELTRALQEAATAPLRPVAS